MRNDPKVIRRCSAMTRTLLVLTVLLAACGAADSTVSSSTTSTSTTTTTTVPEPTTTTTTVPATTTTVPAPDGALPTLPDGRPATWVGVTEDYEAVEVDTVTGEVIHSIGQVSDAEDVATAECSACVNAIDTVTRTYDGAYYFVSQCCEPAAGLIHVLTPEDFPLLGDGLADIPTWNQWSAAPSPDSHGVVFVGYQVVVTSADVPPGGDGPESDYTEAWVNEGEDAFPISNAVWDTGHGAIRWLEAEAGTTRLRSFDLATGSTTTEPIPDLDGWNLAGLALNANGELVVVRSLPDTAASEALVVGVDGVLLDSFTLESGARLGGYDRTGQFLIYTADDGVVRWMGPDGSGILAEGFVHAGW
jgi:hypothetical protein